MNSGEIHVWRVCLEDVSTLPLSPVENARAARFLFERHRQQYLRSHSALHAILRRYTDLPLDFTLADGGKPYLASAPHLKFNLSHSHAMALVGVALDTEVGVDVEHIRPMKDYAAMAERFFPPSEAAELTGESDFFRRWTRIEAVLKARGVGLYGAGSERSGPWTIEDIDAGPAYSAAVAAPVADIQIVLHDFGENA